MWNWLRGLICQADTQQIVRLRREIAVLKAEKIKAEAKIAYLEELNKVHLSVCADKIIVRDIRPSDYGFLLSESSNKEQGCEEEKKVLISQVEQLNDLIRIAKEERAKAEAQITALGDAIVELQAILAFIHEGKLV